MTPPNGSPPFPDGPVSDWTANTPRPTPPPPPRRTDRSQVIDSIGQAVAIQSALGDLDAAICKLKQAGLSLREIHSAFYEALQDSCDH
jgi:hypothetical protein